MKKFLYIVISLICLVSCSQKQTAGNDRVFTKLAVTSSTHVGFLHALGADSLIVGMADPQYCYHSLPGIMDLGSSITIDPERVMASGAEAILLSSYSDDETKAEQMRKVGVEPIFINEWKEDTPLARAAWVKTIGHLIGKDHEADSVYDLVVQEYLALQASSLSNSMTTSNLSNSTQPSIMSGSAWQGTWYVPGPNTYMAHLFSDAGFTYAFSDTTKTSSWGGQEGSIPLTFEQALLAFREADIWVGAPTTTMEALLAMDANHNWFKSFQQGTVYHFNKRTRATGANDFWETGVVHPELILRDLLLIRSNAPDSLLYFSSRLQ